MRSRLGMTNGRLFEKFCPITEGRHMTQSKNGVHDGGRWQGRVSGARRLGSNEQYKVILKS